MMDPGAHLIAGSSYGSLLALVVGILTFLSLISFWRALLDERPRITRIRAVARRRIETQAAGRALQARRRTPRRESLLALVARRARMLRADQTETVTEKLLRSGLRSREAAAAFLMAKALVPVLLALGAVTLPHVAGISLSTHTKMLTIGLALTLGFYAPDLFVANVAAKRKQALQKALPDGLDLLVICAEAGLTLDAALHRVADEVAPSSPELADELTVTSVELNFLPDRKMALLNLVKRVDLPTMRGVVNTLVQTERYGTPLAHALRVLSAELREQRMLRAEEKAAKLPATLTVPMIIFILPTLFIVLIGPALLDIWTRVGG